jgi:hypothetical protein
LDEDKTVNAIADPRWLTATFFFLVQFVLFLRWLHRRLRNDEMTRAFIQDVATNHLPHIYEMLQRLCGQQGIDTSKAPIVRWVDLREPEN